MYDDKNMVPVDAPENKGFAPANKGQASGGFVDDSHQMVQHQLNNLKENVDALLEHLSQCNCPHVQEEEVKKKIILAADYLDSARDYVFSSHGGNDVGGNDVEEGAHGNKNDGFVAVVEKRMEHKPT